METGIFTVAEDLVARINPSRTSLEDYRERAARIDAGDVAARLQLAGWCRDQGLPASARLELERVLAVDPDNASAREALGYRRWNGSWMTEDEVWIARGYVRRDGGWITAAEALAREEAACRAEAELLREAVEESRLRIEALEREAAARDRAAESWEPTWGGGWIAGYVPSCVGPAGLYAAVCAPTVSPRHPTCHVAPPARTSAWYRPPGPAWRFMTPWNMGGAASSCGDRPIPLPLAMPCARR
jgi:hypothetical protein